MRSTRTLTADIATVINKAHRVWLLAALLAVAVVQANASNIVADPGFESGIPGSYTGAMGDG